MKKKIDTRELVEKIARLTRERMSAGPVVSINNFKSKQTKKTQPTLLVIEDDEFVRKSLRRIFEDCGYRVIAASDGAELANFVFDTPIDLILLDVGLPWIDGFEIALMMKEHSDLKSVPLVFISGQNDVAVIKQGFSVGAHDYITKPFDIVKVRKTVDTLLKLNGVI